ncbi:hypothetical protein M422DRAFT_254822 [Sphaerobolus stellatus SS14]|uniref:Cupin type-2 domain-containing protein n=1 Tax=Sphaerobolus stellatus (strain SS14) TaxID=990650 RepID=A0A0C9UGE7_SPHS4|nr:hypothetical protein M422DRAFT_254822 [Sphaerobolus stellatus SS14]
MSHSEESVASGSNARRVVTGLGEDGKAKILYDDREGRVETFPSGSNFQTVWLTDRVPADVTRETNEDPTKGEKLYQGPVNDGSVGVFVNFPPGARAPMHSTKSIDYGIIVEGELELELDNGEKTVLKAGDVIVQRQTKHAWHNRHATQWTKVFFVCIASASSVDEKKN